MTSLLRSTETIVMLIVGGSVLLGTATLLRKYLEVRRDFGRLEPLLAEFDVCFEGAKAKYGDDPSGFPPEVHKELRDHVRAISALEPVQALRQAIGIRLLMTTTGLAFVVSGVLILALSFWQ